LKEEIPPEREELSKGFRSIWQQDFAGLPHYQSQLCERNPNGISRNT